MIVAVLGESDRVGSSILAINLAALRARERRKVLLIDADAQKHTFLWNVRRSGAGMKLHLPVLPILDVSLYSELENLGPRYHDIVIDAGDMDAFDTKTALVAAQMAIIPVAISIRDLRGETKLARCIEVARPFNPALRTLLVCIERSYDDAACDNIAVRALSQAIPSSTVANTVFHDSAGIRVIFGDGLTVFENPPADDNAITEIERLGQEVYGAGIAADGIAMGIKTVSSTVRKLLEVSRIQRQQ